MTCAILGGCGADSECGTLERLCREQCPPSIRSLCVELTDEGDEKVCRASYRGYARACPDWRFFDDS